MNPHLPDAPTQLAEDTDWAGDELREECGVFGIFGHEDATTLVALGLQALQHRGQEAAGIVSSDGKQFYAERRMGLVSDSFTKPSVMKRLAGNSAIGHVRYSTQARRCFEMCSHCLQTWPAVDLRWRTMATSPTR